jgi:Fe-S oxidoreductase
VCPVYYGKSEPNYHPAKRSDSIREIYKSQNTVWGRFLGKIGVKGEISKDVLEQWQKLFYSCTACRRCAQFCPMGIDNSVITRKGRAILDALGKTPITLQKVVQVSLDKHNTDGASAEAFKAAIAFIEEEMQEEHGVEIKIPIDVEGAEYLYLPPSGDVLVNIEATMGIAKVFHVLGLSDRWTMSSKCFDGANYALFTGNDVQMKAINQPIVEEAKRLGVKFLFMGECGHAFRVMKRMMESSQWWGTLPFQVINCIEWTAQAIQSGKVQFDKNQNSDPITYHDPCNFAKSCNIISAPRTILRACCADFREMTPHGAHNWCCGGGGGLSTMNENLEFRMTVSGLKKVEQIRETKARFVAAACSNCKRQLGQLMGYHATGVSVGGVHDLLSRAILVDGKAGKRADYVS